MKFHQNPPQFFISLKINEISVNFSEISLTIFSRASTFHMTFVQIGEFDWLLGRQKGSIFVRMFKNLLLRNHIWDEAETWHTCLGH